MSLTATLLEIDPALYSRRKATLLRLKDEWELQGFFPQPVTDQDINCFWLRFETKYGSYRGFDMWSPAKTGELEMAFLKEHLRYEGVDSNNS